MPPVKLLPGDIMPGLNQGIAQGLSAGEIPQPGSRVKIVTD